MTSTSFLLFSNFIKGLFAWRHSTPGRWGTMWRVTPPNIYMDRRVSPPKRVTSPIWGTPSPCKQALSVVIWTKDDRVLIIQQILRNFIHDTRYLCRHLRTGGIKAMSRGFSGGSKWKNFQLQEFILDNRKWRTFHLEDDSSELWMKRIIVTSLGAVATPNVLTLLKQ